MSEGGEVRGAARHRAERAWWALAAGAAVLAGAWWLREPAVRYLAACAIATAAAAVLAWREPRRRRAWPVAFAAAAVLLCALATAAQRQVRRVERAWPAYRDDLEARSARLLGTQLDELARTLREQAALALDAPADAPAAFERLAELSAGTVERGTVLYRRGMPVAWGGRVRVPTDSLTSPSGATRTPFYLTLHASAQRGPARAVATALVHAEPPADRISAPLHQLVARRTGIASFDFSLGPPPSGEPGWRPFPAAGTAQLYLRPLAPTQAETRLRLIEEARLRGALLLAAAVTCLVAGVWRRARGRTARFGALAVALGVVAVVPLNTFSNATRLFDPAIYFAPLGGPFTASAGALGITSGLVLLGLLALLRSSVRFPSRWLALATVLVIAGVGPFLLRGLAKGIFPPSYGVTAGLWLGWQVTLFLAAVSILLAGASAGRAALGARRGLSPLVAPSFAAGAALLAPIVWDAPGAWPAWYPLPWVAAIGALALTRRSRGVIVSAAVVAGLGAATLVWGATTRKRVELAEHEVRGLTAVDPYAAALLERFATDLAGDDPPASRAELLQRYVASDLAAADYPVRLGTWSDDSLRAELRMAEIEVERDSLLAVVRAARASGTRVQRPVAGTPGVQIVLAVPAPGGRTTTVVVGPATRLIPEEPFAALLGVAQDPVGEPRYAIALAPADSLAIRQSSARVWKREGNELHGDWILAGGRTPVRVHAEVELRSLEALVERGTLVLLLDLALVALLWNLNLWADGGFARWLRRRRSRWARSYRTRLTFALFAFFVIPAAAFALWSYRRLASDDRQYREVLVGETLRAVAASDARDLADESRRLQTPLFRFVDGELTETSDELYALLGSIGRFLDREVELNLALSDEPTANSVERIGAAQVLFGYRAAVARGGERAVLAAPARTDDLALDRRRRDLGILVLFATAIGGLAALGLSGVAARELARPIGSLRDAALAIAAGEREPPLAIQPPQEFVPVFSAFRRMAADLSASRTALEEAQRRTAAILRNVASGVVAFGADLTVTLANPRADALLGCRLPPGTPISALAAPAVEAQVRGFLASGAAQEEEFDLELRGRQLHGRLTPLAGGGTVLTLDDVTELARAQRVLAWGEMARQVAHEIKNPLTPIRLGVQHLRRARADARVDFDRVLDQNVSRILAEIDRLDEIARAFSRYGTAPAEAPQAVTTDVAAVVRDVVALERMGEGTVDWRVTGEDRPALAAARGDELREVLLNVLENARLANARRVDVHLARENGRVSIVVEDDGEGIPPEILPRIFEPHFSTRTSGSGLGLAISRRLLEQWGGEIAVTSARGRGTRVEIGLKTE